MYKRVKKTNEKFQENFDGIKILKTQFIKEVEVVDDTKFFISNFIKNRHKNLV